VHATDRPVLGEPALASGLVELPSACRALRPGDALEDGRADPAAESICGTQVSHLPIINAFGQADQLRDIVMPGAPAMPPVLAADDQLALSLCSEPAPGQRLIGSVGSRRPRCPQCRHLGRLRILEPVLAL
jgi:hypothetical protein